MFQKTYKTLGYMEIIVFKLPPGEEQYHIYPMTYMLWVLKRIVSMRQFFEAPNTRLN